MNAAVNSNVYGDEFDASFERSERIASIVQSLFFIAFLNLLAIPLAKLSFEFHADSNESVMAVVSVAVIAYAVYAVLISSWHITSRAWRAFVLSMVTLAPVVSAMFLQF